MSHLEREEKITKFWKDNSIFEKSVENRPKNKQYVFYDGPPFATGLPHYGHILGLTSKDVFPRYWTMKGYRCERRWGWDCHGLPIENIAEKELGIKEKTEIVSKGVDKFNNFCRNKVMFYASEWKKTVDRMGKWIEFDDSYKTMDTDYMETIWNIFKTLYDKKLIYEGKKILMYCPRCETPIAKAEIAMDKSYKDVTEKTATAKFKLKDEDAYILAWTTTPWTLIGNVAIAVNPKLDYVKIKTGNEELILLKDKLSLIKSDYKIIKEFKGKELIGKSYDPLYTVPLNKKANIIIDGGKEVNSEEGTGIVHMAIYGEFDYEMIKKYDLEAIQHIDDSGKLKYDINDWKGTYFKKLDKLVIQDLEDRDLLFSAEPYTHSYPFCYRCNAPLFYNAVDSWFVDIQKIKPQLLKTAKDIHWHPKGKVETLFNNLIKTAPDWTISRNRFWATPIPAWKCDKCNEVKVIGSIEELKKYSKEKISKNLDLHKDAVDGITFTCEKCKGKMSRVPEVIDCWFESGSMPYASKHYPFENKEFFKTNYPCDFVSEYIGQVRAWFYYMHVIGNLLFNKPPFKHIVVTGNILASDGTKMSKSKNNYPDPNLIFDKYGADTLRFFLMNCPVIKAQDISFKEESVKDIYRKVITLLSNVSNFYGLFSDNNKEVKKYGTTNILDKWIISKLHSLIKIATKSLDDYDPVKACDEIMNFISELSTWYVRRSRDRFKQGDNDSIQTLAHVLYNLSKVMAPITPFITEEIYQSLRKNNNKLMESVHLDTWPTYDEELINNSINKKMELVRQIVSAGLEARDKEKIPVRQPLSKITIKGAKLSKEYSEVIMEELNVKKVVYVEAKELSAKLDTKLTKELQKEGIVRELIRNLNSERKKIKLTIQDRITLYFNTSDELVMQSFKENQEQIMSNIQADKVIFDSGDSEIKANNSICSIKIKTN